MNRRSFVRSFIGAAIAVSTAARLSLQPETARQTIQPKFDPVEYVGEYRWINLAPFPDMGKFRESLNTPT